MPYDDCEHSSLVEVNITASGAWLSARLPEDKGYFYSSLDVSGEACLDCGRLFLHLTPTILAAAIASLEQRSKGPTG